MLCSMRSRQLWHSQPSLGQSSTINPISTRRCCNGIGGLAKGIMIYLSICLFIDLCIYLSVCVSIYLSNLWGHATRSYGSLYGTPPLDHGMLHGVQQHAEDESWTMPRGKEFGDLVMFSSRTHRGLRRAAPQATFQVGRFLQLTTMMWDI